MDCKQNWSQNPKMSKNVDLVLVIELIVMYYKYNTNIIHIKH